MKQLDLARIRRDDVPFNLLLDGHRLGGTAKSALTLV